MQLFIKLFSELTADELYRILKIRVAVFVVEQKCAYLETDDLDQSAVHVWFEDEDGIKAYVRVMDSGVEADCPAIGRVIAAVRGKGLGRRIVAEGIRVAMERFHARSVYLEAQTYAKGFYEKQGFRQCSEEFILDGIPHVKMMMNCEKLPGE